MCVYATNLLIFNYTGHLFFMDATILSGANLIKKADGGS